MTYTFGKDIQFRVPPNDNYLVISERSVKDNTVFYKKVKLKFNKVIGYEYQEVYNTISGASTITKSWKLLVEFDNFTIIIYCAHIENNNYLDTEKEAHLLFKAFLSYFFSNSYIEF